MPAFTDVDANSLVPLPVLQVRAEAHERPWPLLQVGTGGVPTIEFYISSVGYQPFRIIVPAEQVREAVYARLMEQIRGGFGRTLNRLPRVFGVTRQTLYNWLAGDTPKSAHQEKLKQLTAAAQVFCDLGFKPTAVSLDRPLVNGRSILELIAAGEDGKDVALKLVRLERHGAASKDRLARLLAGKQPKQQALSYSASLVGEGGQTT